jgi:competence protein ComEC
VRGLNSLYLPCFVLAFAGGVSLGLSNPVLASEFALPLSVLAALSTWGVRAPRAMLWVLLAAGAAAGMVRGAAPPPAALPPSDGLWQLDVVSGQRPAMRTGRWEAELVAHDSGHGFERVAGRVRVGGHAAPWLLQPGERLVVRGRLLPMREAAHAMAWDPAAAMRRAGLVGELRTTSEPIVIAHRWRLRAPVERARMRVERAVLTTVPAREAGVLLALLTGTRSEIDPADRDRFSRSGAAHVLAVSGLHLGLLILAFFRATRWFLRHVVRRASWPGADALAAWATLPVLLAYVCFTGWPASACRAGLMASVMLFGIGAERPASSFHALCVSSLVLLAWRPLWLHDLGFQLSVTATASLIAAGAARRAWSTPARGVLANALEGLRASIVATVATAPCLFWVLGSIPVMSPIANVFVVPPLALVALPCGVLGAWLVGWELPFGESVLFVARLAVSFALWVGERGEAPLTTTLWWGRPGPWSMLGWCVFAIASPALFVGRRMLHLVVLVLVLPALWLDAPRRWRAADTPRVEIIPSGADTAALWLESRNGRTMVIDPGATTALGGRASAMSIRSWIHGAGYGRVDVLVVTDCSVNRSAAALNVARWLRPSEVWLTADVIGCPRGEQIAEVVRENNGEIRAGYGLARLSVNVGFVLSLAPAASEQELGACGPQSSLVFIVEFPSSLASETSAPGAKRLAYCH